MSACNIETLADFCQFCHFFVREFSAAAEFFCKFGNFGIKLNRFHIKVCTHQCIADGQRAVILQQEGVVVLDVGLQRFGNFIRGRSAVCTNGHGAEEQYRFGHDILIQRNIAHCKSG